MPVLHCVGVGRVNDDLRAQVVKLVVGPGVVGVAVRVDHPADLLRRASAFFDVGEGRFEFGIVSGIDNGDTFGAAVDHIGKIRELRLADQVDIAQDSGGHRQGTRRRIAVQAEARHRLCRRGSGGPWLVQRKLLRQLALLEWTAGQRDQLAFFGTDSLQLRHCGTVAEGQREQEGWDEKEPAAHDCLW